QNSKRAMRLRLFFVSSRRRHTRFSRDWSSDVCSSDLFYPRERKPGNLALEESFGQETLDALAAMGHQLEVAPPFTIGRMVAAAQIGRASCRDRSRSSGGAACDDKTEHN